MIEEAFKSFCLNLIQSKYHSCISFEFSEIEINYKFHKYAYICNIRINDQIYHVIEFQSPRNLVDKQILKLNINRFKRYYESFTINLNSLSDKIRYQIRDNSLFFELIKSSVDFHIYVYDFLENGSNFDFKLQLISDLLTHSMGKFKSLHIGSRINSSKYDLPKLQIENYSNTAGYNTLYQMCINNISINEIQFDIPLFLNENILTDIEFQNPNLKKLDFVLAINLDLFIDKYADSFEINNLRLNLPKLNFLSIDIKYFHGIGLATKKRKDDPTNTRICWFETEFLSEIENLNHFSIWNDQFLTIWDSSSLTFSSIHRLSKSNKIILAFPYGFFRFMVNPITIDISSKIIIEPGAFSNIMIKSLSLNLFSVENKIFSGMNIGALSVNIDLTNLERGCFEDVVNIDHLTIRGRLNRINNLAFLGLHKTRKLIIKKAELSIIEPQAFFGLKKLEFLKLENNKIEEIKKGLFEGLFNLKSITLQYNHLNRIDENVFTELKNLEYINLSKNFFTDVDLINTLIENLPISANISYSLDKVDRKNLIQDNIDGIKKLDRHNLLKSNKIITPVGKTPSPNLLERSIQEFLRDHILNKEINKFDFSNDNILSNLELYYNGFEFVTTVGRIDLLCYNKLSQEFVIIELKRDRVSDKVIGQTLRYIGWVKNHYKRKASAIIIGKRFDNNFKYALIPIDSKISILYFKSQENTFTFHEL